MQKSNHTATNTINCGGHGVNSTMMDGIVDGTNYSDNKYDALSTHIVGGIAPGWYCITSANKSIRLFPNKNNYHIPGSGIATTTKHFKRIMLQYFGGRGYHHHQL